MPLLVDLAHASHASRAGGPLDAAADDRERQHDERRRLREEERQLQQLEQGAAQAALPTRAPQPGPGA